MKYLQDNKDNKDNFDKLHNQYILLRRDLRNQIMSNDKCSSRLYSKLVLYIGTYMLTYYEILSR